MHLLGHPLLLIGRLFANSIRIITVCLRCGIVKAPMAINRLKCSQVKIKEAMRVNRS